MAVGLVAAAAPFATTTALADSAELVARAKTPPKDPAEALALGVELRQVGRFAESVRVLRSAYGHAARGDVAAAVRLNAARSLVAQGKLKDALRECASLKLVSTLKRHDCEGEVHLASRRATLALPAAHAALQIDPTDYDGLVVRGRAQRQRGKLAIAEKVLRRAISHDASRWEAHFFLADVLVGQGKKDDAVAELRAATTAAPGEPEPWLQLGSNLPAGDEAVAALRSAVAIRPTFGGAQAALGQALLDLGQFADAEAALRAAVALDAKQADWHAGLARVLLAKGAPADALVEANLALKLVANNGAAKLVQADALAATGEIDPAIAAYEAAFSLSRSQPTALVSGARACLAAQRPTTAQAFAERATQEFPDWGPAWEVAGDAHLAVREKSAAKAAYQKALAGQGPTDRAAVQRKLDALR